MKASSYLAALIAVSVLIFFRVEASRGAVISFLVLAALMAIPLYFGTRDRNKPPSIVESVIAHLWVWFRRFLGLLLGGPMAFGGIYFLFVANPREPNIPWYGCVLLSLFGFFVLYLGFVGQGTDRNAFRDDIKLHQENKRRYKWWF